MARKRTPALVTPPGNAAQPVSEGLDNVVGHGETRPLQTNRYVLRTLGKPSELRWERERASHPWGTYAFLQAPGKFY